MSGRKKSEVVDLLSSSEQIRNNVLKNTFKNIENLLRKNNQILEKLKKLEIELNMALPTLSSEAKKRYIEEIKRLENLLVEIENFEYKDEYTNLEIENKKMEEILGVFREIDMEADRLRNLIINKSYYCDSEYAQATVLVNRAREKQNEFLELERKIENKTRKNSMLYEKSKSLKEKKNSIASSYENINQRALADNNREQLIKEFSKINEGWANKFLKDEYLHLKDEINSIEKEKDISIINGKASELFKKISDTNNIILEKKQEFDLKKQRAERELKELIDRVEEVFFDDIEENLMNGNGTQIGLFDFEDKYSNYSSREEYINLKKKIEQLIEKEEFDISFGVLEKTRDFIEKSIQSAMKQYEKLLKEQDIVSKIVGAAYELGYDVSVNCIDEDIRNGYTLEAIAGDEIINFDRILVDPDGKTVIDMDHQESVNGTCGDVMKNFMKAMQKEGIFITDITKEGRSAIYKDKQVSMTNKTNNITMTQN